MLAALVVRGRTKTPRRNGLNRDAGKKTVEREVEIEAGLLAIGDHVEAGGHLVVHGDSDGVIEQFRQIVGAKFIEATRCEFEPARKGITADDRGAQGALFHDLSTYCPAAVYTDHLPRDVAR